MNDPNLIWAGAVIIVTAMICVTGQKCWRGWLELKRLDLPQAPSADDAAPAVRIEVADLKERLRKLEAIARGVDL